MWVYVCGFLTCNESEDTRDIIEIVRTMKSCKWFIEHEKKCSRKTNNNIGAYDLLHTWLYVGVEALHALKNNT